MSHFRLIVKSIQNLSTGPFLLADFIIVNFFVSLKILPLRLKRANLLNNNII